jgi:hypothetical protein
MAPDPLPHIPVTCGALWVDKGIAFATAAAASPEDKVEASSKLLGLLKDRRNVNPEWKGIFFLGFFFKGTNRSFAPDATPQQQKALIRAASEQLDALGPDVVCCTSGPGTGVPLEHDRATLYHDFVKGPIAVASGVAKENIHEMLDKRKHSRDVTLRRHLHGRALEWKKRPVIMPKLSSLERWSCLLL